MNKHLMRVGWFASALLLFSTTAAFAGPKVEVCHVPPGNPANFHTIKVSENALSAHLAHGDIAGPCNAACASLCDDGDACTIDDTGDCEQNGCPLTPEPVNCDDGNSCTENACDAVAGCVYTPQPGLSCDDGHVCTGPDMCNAEGLCAGPAIDNCCTDNAQCSQDFCDQASCDLLTNTCQTDPVQCTPPDACTVSACSNIDGMCVDTPVACNDGEQCNPANGQCEPIVTTQACPCWTEEEFARFSVEPRVECSFPDLVFISERIIYARESVTGSNFSYVRAKVESSSLLSIQGCRIETATNPPLPPPHGDPPDYGLAPYDIIEIDNISDEEFAACETAILTVCNERGFPYSP